MKMNHFGKASTAILAVTAAACASDSGMTSKQKLINHYAASQSLSIEDAETAFGEIKAAAKAQCRPRGPRRGAKSRSHRICITRFTNDVVRQVNNPQLNAVSRRRTS